jgi:ABC-type uncharacterized transport system substrate-binding protein
VIDRRAFIGLAAGGLLAGPLAAEAQAPTKVPRIGFLVAQPTAISGPYLEAFRQGLRELGYVEGQNIAFESRSAEGKYERLPALAADLVRMNVDVVVTSAPPAATAAKQATSTIPIVFTSAIAPDASGLVVSLARPGGNVTGLALMGREVVGKHLELLKEVAPRVSRVAILQNPARPGLREVEGAARSLGLQLHVVQASTAAEIDAAFAEMRSQRPAGVLVLRDPFFFQRRTQIVALAAKSRLPAVYGFREDAEAGGLMAYAPNILQMWRRSATYVDKILKGAKPGELPIEQPSKFELIINLKTAKALGLTIPPALLARADQLLE